MKHLLLLLVAALVTSNANARGAKPDCSDERDKLLTLHSLRGLFGAMAVEEFSKNDEFNVQTVCLTLGETLSTVRDFEIAAKYGTRLNPKQIQIAKRMSQVSEKISLECMEKSADRTRIAKAGAILQKGFTAMGEEFSCFGPIENNLKSRRR